MPMTAREIAERTGHGASDNRFIERLHYWTRERLLVPMGKRNPGTGRHRVYPDTAVQEALILNAMMDRGVPVEDQRRVMKAIQERRQQTPDLWPRLKEGVPDLFLAIETYQRQSRAWFYERKYEMDPQFEDAIVFNLKKLLPVPNETGGASG